MALHRPEPCADSINCERLQMLEVGGGVGGSHPYRTIYYSIQIEDVHGLYVDSVSSHMGARACLHADPHG